MKLITAIVKPSRVDDIKHALQSNGIQGMTVSEVRGYGRQRGRTEKYRGSTYIVNLLPKVKVEFVVPDEAADDAVEALLHAAQTGEIGDGKVFVSTIESAVRIRTEEAGDQAV